MYVLRYVKDLDAYKYLNNLRYRKLSITTKELRNGKTLEIKKFSNDQEYPKVGNHVTIDFELVSDGIYESEHPKKKYIIKNSIIKTILHEVTYKTKEGIEIIIEQNDQFNYYKGDKVWINGKAAQDGKYKIIDHPNFIVENGIIIRKMFSFF
jgi:hypothetical protein